MQLTRVRLHSVPRATCPERSWARCDHIWSSAGDSWRRRWGLAVVSWVDDAHPPLRPADVASKRTYPATVAGSEPVHDDSPWAPATVTVTRDKIVR
jgi:hypothetical protein